MRARISHGIVRARSWGDERASMPGRADSFADSGTGAVGEGARPGTSGPHQRSGARAGATGSRTSTTETAALLARGRTFRSRAGIGRHIGCAPSGADRPHPVATRPAEPAMNEQPPPSSDAAFFDV